MKNTGKHLFSYWHLMFTNKWYDTVGSHPISGNEEGGGLLVTCVYITDYM